MPANIVPSHPCEDREGSSGRLSAHRAIAVVNAWRSRENVVHRAAEASAHQALLPGAPARHLVTVRHRPSRGEGRDTAVNVAHVTAWRVGAGTAAPQTTPQ